MAIIAPQKVVLAAAMALLLQGCGHTPVTRTLVDAFGAGKGVASTVLSPNFRYLKVTANGREALMALGYSDPHPDGPIDTWYSSEGEVIRLQNGRLLSTAGLELNWKSVRYRGLPDWRAVVSQGKLEFTRERDEMPGHRFGLMDRLDLYAVPPPKDAHLLGVDPNGLRWFEERVQSSPASLPSARYGLAIAGGEAKVVYGEQCLSERLCIAWQTWPAKP